MTDGRETIEAPRDYVRNREPESAEAPVVFILQFLNSQGWPVSILCKSNTHNDIPPPHMLRGPISHLSTVPYTPSPELLRGYNETTGRVFLPRISSAPSLWDSFPSHIFSSIIYYHVHHAHTHSFIFLPWLMQCLLFSPTEASLPVLTCIYWFTAQNISSVRTKMLACLLMFEISSQSGFALLGAQWLFVNRWKTDDKQTQQ